MIKHLRQLSALLALGILSINANAQNPAKNWQNKSIEQDSVYGTGSDKAIELLKSKGVQSTTVIVAVIDNGVCVNHPALKNHIWVNPKEIAGNKADDDHNGYIDDVNGWDFIGGKDSSVDKDNIELTRLYRELGKKYATTSNADKLSKKDKLEYAKYQKVKKAFESKQGAYQKQYDGLKDFMDNIDKIKVVIGKNDFNQEDMDAYKPTDSVMIKTKERLGRNFGMLSSFMKGVTADSIKKQIKGGLDYLNTFLLYQYNVNFDPRPTVGDNYADITQKYYGNNDLNGKTAGHGTHVSGIISGNRTGVASTQEGIADNVKIMGVRVVPDGDERDKDVANGIRYAVDNGAKVINMSFGKGWSYNKKAVDEAVKYAEKHDVLLVHAAGNDNQNNDSVDNFPTRRYENSHKQAKNWIEVGASDVNGKPGSFSNYGKNSVDLFAPGVKIYSSIPDSGYAYFNGTSMASPCVAGVAALIREYFPKLSAKQVREILMESVTKITALVPKPAPRGTKTPVLVSYTDLCISGGTINAYKAVQLALKKSGK